MIEKLQLLTYKKLIVIPEKSFSWITSQGMLVVPEKFSWFHGVLRDPGAYKGSQGTRGSQRAPSVLRILEVPRILGVPRGFRGSRDWITPFIYAVNTLMNSHAPLKNLNKKQRNFQFKNFGLQKKSKIQLKRKIGSLKSWKSTLNVMIYIKNTKHIEKAYQLYCSKAKYIIIMIMNFNNIKKTLKGIKSIISLNTKESESPKIIIYNKGELTSKLTQKTLPKILKYFFVLLHLLSNLK